MNRRVIFAIPAPQLDAQGAVVNPLMDVPEGKGFYAKLGAQIVGCIDYITTTDPPVSALYVCEEHSPSDYRVTVNTPGLVAPHGWMGWPAVDGSQRLWESPK
jgi:hypothetical protein